MSLKAESYADDELGHIRDTLTGMVSFASNTRAEMLRRFDQQDKVREACQQENRSRFNKLETDVAGLKIDVAELKTDVANLKADVSELKSDMKEVKSDISELKSGVADIKAILLSK